MSDFKRKYKGYTIMELIVSLGFIMLLAYGAVVGVNHYYSAGRYNTVRSDLSVISMAVSKYRFEKGSYPADLNALTVRTVPYGPWLTKELLEDPWGNTYRYVSGSDHYAVWSCGADKINNSGNPLTTGFSGDDIGEIRK